MKQTDEKSLALDKINQECDLVEVCNSSYTRIWGFSSKGFFQQFNMKINRTNFKFWEEYDKEDKDKFFYKINSK
jgi:hypothetical protein